MAKRGYKLQEFVAHAGNVNCLTFGKKNCRVFITGGDDQKVNLWSIGKPTSVTSLCGHTSPVESAAFDSTEVLVIAGSSSGAIKLWDLEETKMVRTLTGHRSYCTAVEFHPFGEFFASGSMDTNLKIWDIRKKGCIHTYKGHTRGISTIRFTPDGRWVVSGGFDNVVKVWDLTAGKLLHDFKFHEGHIRSIEFHPLEFLLATGSADKTVKFWDLETFEMIGSARREATGVRSIAFHPDGRTLFCGLDDSLKVYSWEPVICHDSVDMGWSTLGDLCIHDGKLLGGAYYENSVAVWVADVSLIEPYGTRLAPEEYSHSDEKGDGEKIPSEKDEGHIKAKPDLQFDTQDTDSKEIKTIYVDRVNSVTPKAAEPIDVPKVIRSSESKDISIVITQKRGPAASLPAKANAPAVKNRSIVIPSIVPRDGPDGKDFVGSRRESTASAKAGAGMPSKQSARRLSTGRIGMERMTVSLDSLPSETAKSRFGLKKDSDLRDRVIANENAKVSSDEKLSNVSDRLVTNGNAKESSDKKLSNVSDRLVTNGNAKESLDEKLSNVSDRLVTNGNAKESAEEKQSNIKSVADNLDITSSLATVSSEQSPDSNKGVTSVKVINGVTVVQGRTRSLVERFEKKEKLYADEVQKPERGSSPTAEPLETPPNEKPDSGSGLTDKPLESPQTEKPDSGSGVTSEPLEIPPIQKPNIRSGMTVEPLEIPRIQKPNRGFDMTAEPLESPQIQNPNRGSGMPAEPLESPRFQQTGGRSHATAEPLESPSATKPNRRSHVTSEPLESPSVPKPNRRSHVTVEPLESPSIPKPDRRFRMTAESMETSPILRSNRRSRVTAEPLEIPPIPRSDRRLRVSAEPPETPPIQRFSRGFGLNAEPLETPLSQNCDQKTVVTEGPSSGENIAIENLMQSHDVLLSTFRSRLTKLQVVRHFWERNDLKGAINAVKKLPDHSVQADVAGVLIERLDRITLDLFSCLLPVLLGLLESKAERHVTVSLEMLLKLVAVFGTTVHSTVSAPPGVGVDLHAEERRECCRQCLAYLDDIRNKLPELVKRGGSFARFAQQLNLVLQQT